MEIQDDDFSFSVNFQLNLKPCSFPYMLLSRPKESTNNCSADDKCQR